MKPIQLFTSMLALTAIVVTSCSAPRMAQQTNSDDDVYNTMATAKVYTPAPVVAPSQTPQEETYNEDDYYGTSDPYYDQDYSSRINRFYYASPWRTYYDPYYYNGWYSDFGWGSYAGMGWGYMNSPFWGYNGFGLGLGWNSWGYNNWGWNSYYGGGFLGGGYYGGGLYGGGYYTGRTTNVPDYRSRPRVGRENGVGANSRFGNPRSSVVRTDANGNVIPSRSRSERAAAANAATRTDRGTATRPARAEAPRTETQQRPARTESARPARTESRPTYTPPARTESSRGSSSSSGSGSSSRPTRAGRG